MYSPESRIAYDVKTKVATSAVEGLVNPLSEKLSGPGAIMYLLSSGTRP
jgi:hypothetical protein